MTLTVKNIVAAVLAIVTILGCLVLFIHVTRSRELDESERSNMTTIQSVFEKAAAASFPS